MPFVTSSVLVPRPRRPSQERPTRRGAFKQTVLPQCPDFHAAGRGHRPSGVLIGRLSSGELIAESAGIADWSNGGGGSWKTTLCVFAGVFLPDHKVQSTLSTYCPKTSHSVVGTEPQFAAT